MSDTPTPSDEAEARTTKLLALVATQPPALSGRFTDELMRKVRVQRLVATPLRAVGTLVAAIAGGLGAAFIAHSRRSGS